MVSAQKKKINSPNKCLLNGNSMIMMRIFRKTLKYTGNSHRKESMNSENCREPCCLAHLLDRQEGPILKGEGDRGPQATNV